MTNLTEQYRKGELNNGFYYVEINEPFMPLRVEIVENYNGLETDIDNNYIVEILAEVPSYEKWQAKLEENAQLKELLRECELWFTSVVGNMNDKNCGEHNRNLPIGNFEHVFRVFSQKINQVLGEE